MTENAARFLGFAFASADLLFEVDPEGRIVFVMGATKRILGMDQAEATGRGWTDVIAESDHDLVAALFDGLGAADRRGPVKVELKPSGSRSIRRYAHLSACRLPQVAPNVSCVLAMGALSGEIGGAIPPEANSLHDRKGFMAATQHLLDGARTAGLDLNLELVELRGLHDATAAMEPQAAEALRRRVASAIRAESFRGQGAAQLGDERFAVLRDRTDSPDYLLSRLQKAATAAGAEVEARSASLSLAPETTPLHTMRALRFALDSFLKDGAASAQTAFQKVLENTVTQANAFSRAVREQRFQLVYQPVVAIHSGELQHFETLVRFDGDKSPAQAIRMAEELELIQSLDLAVIQRVVKKLTAPASGRLRLAVNMSARSLMQPSFIPALFDLLNAHSGLGERLIFEITESAALEDLDQANAAIQRIRRHGFQIYLDDFGAGAASMAYLRALTVDAVKIDGQYVRELAQSERDTALVRHLAQLCEELGVSCVAEMVETEEAARTLQEIGVTYGQGWHFGKPSSEPTYVLASPVRARRAGEIDTWR